MFTVEFAKNQHGKWRLSIKQWGCRDVEKQKLLDPLPRSGTELLGEHFPLELHFPQEYISS